ncbi:hypothetical protein M405DRAFT_834383 [Rhizopogon salebrosus TDB-379]|nr:hypothetical protein M405DRAFT_834383 [Rhizopogon salebrosus TDB-379]
MLIELSYTHDEKLTILYCNLLENKSQPLMAWRTDLDLLDHLQDAVPSRCDTRPGERILLSEMKWGRSRHLHLEEE